MELKDILKLVDAGYTKEEIAKITEVKETEVKETEVKETEVKETEVKETEVKETEVKETPKTIKEFSELIKTLVNEEVKTIVTNIQKSNLKENLAENNNDLSSEFIEGLIR